MLLRNTTIVFLVSSLAACGGGGSSSTPIAGTTPPQATLIDQLQGTWERHGYGKVVRISGERIETFDVTSQTCYLAETESTDDYPNARMSEDETEFSIQFTALSFEERYSKVNSLPAVCDSPIGNRPTEIFEHLWLTFEENYAFFSERNVDWLAQYDATRDRVSDAMSSDEFLDVLNSLLLPLDDEHVSLVAGEQIINPARPKGLIAQLIAEYESQSVVSELGDYINRELLNWDAFVRDVYLDGDAETTDERVFTWGTISDDIGYLKIDSMILNFDESLDDQLARVEEILDQIFSDLAQTDSMIVDIRLNGGGADAIAFAIAQRFTDVERSVVSKFTRTSAGAGAMQSVSISPVDRPSYQNPIVLITSGFSTSAAEVFTLAMRSLPQVTHAGEVTNGSLSDVLEKPLPNGWEFQLSNEVYLDADGVSYEAIGIPPDTEISVFAFDERQRREDSALNGALALLGFGG